MNKIKYIIESINNFKWFHTKCPYKILDKWNDYYHIGSLWEMDNCKYFHSINENERYVLCKYKTLMNKLDKLEELLEK